MFSWLDSLSDWKSKLGFVVIVVISFLIGVGGGVLYERVLKGMFNNSLGASGSVVDIDTDKSRRSDTLLMEGSTEITLREKDSPEDPDLIVDNNYIATIDGETHYIPLVRSRVQKEPNDTYSDSQVTVAHTLDLTPVLEEVGKYRYDRNWSVGLGLGYDNDGSDFYSAISVERKFNPDRSVEAIVGINSSSKIENVTLMYKWSF